METYCRNIREAVGHSERRFHKATLFQGRRLMLGVNCLDQGQSQAVHTHADQDKFYMVREGTGWFTVGDQEIGARDGDVVWCPAGVPHGVRNAGPETLVLLMGMAPSPGEA